MAHTFEIWKDKAGEFRVRFKYNEEVMFSTEGYSSKASARNGIESIKKNGPGAPTEDDSRALSRPHLNSPGTVPGSGNCVLQDRPHCSGDFACWGPSSSSF
jgi:uncharacterized protein YegP (UPF0339 family)